ncbi:MAG: CotH kinase family protein [Prevotella sp.]|nr:CotH kinase family protein [Prevotella sp.]
MKQLLLLLTTLYCGSMNAQTLVINEIMQSNVECTMDDIKEFPDSWVELYNPTDAAINLKDYKISNKNKEKKAWKLPDMTVAAHGYVLVYCDKEGKEDNRLHADFRLESGKGCTVYLFTNQEVVDSLPADMKKMPAPDIAFGRKTDGGDQWGYQLTATPGEANCGNICEAKHILGAPVFSEPGRVTSNNSTVSLTVSVPDDAPEGAYIMYTTDGSEPQPSDAAVEQPRTVSLNITNTTVVRAKVCCDGWLSPMSSAQSYIFHPRTMTIPIFSVQTNDKYLNDAAIGLFANNNSKEDKKLHDWRRPVNIEFFPAEGENSAFNQLGETRIQGGQSRGNALKSMVFYANKRFDPDHKRFSYEFFPDQKPGITEFKSFSLRDGGNDFGDLYFRDLIIQRTMASHVDLDWQAGHSAVLYINGEYMGMLNIRERSNEDNIYSNYDGLEDLDLIEISHEKINNIDQFEEEFKEGDADFYNNFKAFYSEKGHSMAEYEQWIDVNEYLNVIAMNFFYGNIDFPGNNIVFWRPNDDATADLPKRFRVIVKDTDFGLGLYGRQNSYNTIDLLYNPSNYPNDNWAFTTPATTLLKNMLENDDIRNLFIDKCCIFMGDFMNGKGTGATIDLIQAEAMEEFVAHRDKYNPGWGWWSDNRGEITNKFNDAKNWAEGRPNYFYQHIGNQWNLGTPRTLTINKTNKSDVEITFNGIKLSDKVFDGKYFKNRAITLTATANEEGKTVTGWKVTGSLSKEVQGSELTLTMPNGNIAIEPVVGVGSGIEELSTVNSQLSTLYDLLGNKVQTPQAGKIYIQNGKKVVIK